MTMNCAKVAGATVLLFFGIMMPGYAQREGREDEQGGKGDVQQGKSDRSHGKQDKGASGEHQRAPQPQQEPRQKGNQQERQAPQQVQRQDQQQQRPQIFGEQQAPQRTEQQARAWQQQRGWLQQGAWQAHDTWQQTRTQRWYSEHRTWTERGGYGGYYIPQDRFSVYFGSRHPFRLHTRPVIYLGYPRFEYGGFSFLLVDPWPEYWAENWYDSDDLYIDYDDGYYLYNRNYNQVRLAIAIAL
jgi:hypothetical protein